MHKNKKFEIKTRQSSTIPFGYRYDINLNKLLPITNELNLLEIANDLYKDKKLSLRYISNWLTKKSGRYISHVGLHKIFNKEKLNNKEADYSWKVKFGSNAKRIGDVSEHLVISRLLQCQWEVFKNVSSVGPIDIYAVDLTSNRGICLDVKTVPSNVKCITSFLNDQFKKYSNKKMPEVQCKLNVCFSYYIQGKVYILLKKENEVIIV